ncbi:MAG: sulfite exporter TauE/SafE family protein [Chloroflexota bacterium]
MTDLNLNTDLQTNTLSPMRINWRRWLYPIVLVSIYFVWFTYMSASRQWHLLAEHWTISLTMTFGSLVAGATAEGGGAVAFPVFTKLLHIAPNDARTFGLMIQAVGMTTAALVIYLNRIKVLGNVILWVSIGGFFGQILGTYLLVIPPPYPRILFTLVAGMFGVTMLIQMMLTKEKPKQAMPAWIPLQKALFLVTGVIGGIFAAQTGAGVDMMAFIVLTIVYRMNIKISTPTTVVIMAINSIIGFYLHGVISQDIGIVWEYWLVAIPIVIIGAPLGAYLASKVPHNAIAIFLLSLIALEVVTTIWLIPFGTEQLIVTGIAIAITGIVLMGLLWLHRRIYGS